LGPGSVTVNASVDDELIDIRVANCQCCLLITLFESGTGYYTGRIILFRPFGSYIGLLALDNFCSTGIVQLPQVCVDSLYVVFQLARSIR
jgi:hypothetical protein